VLISAANGQAGQEIARLVGLAGDLSAEVVPGEPEELIAAADLVLVASGTGTLHVAHQGRPMVIMYNASKWGYRLVGRHLIRTRHLALLNILAGREIVPEFMPYYASTRPIIETVLALLDSRTRREQQSCDLAKVIRPLQNTQPTATVAEMALGMMCGSKQQLFAAS
jgi:lipid-A-disaccharide synthase